MSDVPSISVIIVTYNSAKVIGYCLESLGSQSFQSLEVIIVDNNSSDNTKEVISEYGHCLIKNDSNVGFAKACHQGADSAKGDILLFLNPDTILPPDICQNITSHIETGKDVGAVSPVLIDGLGRVLPETARKVPSPSGALRYILNISSTSYYQKLDEASHKGITVACGACLAIRKDVWEETGGFDTRYFMYAEDVDLSYQIRKYGYRISLMQDTYVIHLKGESTNKKGWTYNRHFYNSINLFVHKYHGELYSHLQSSLSSLFTLLLSITSFLLQFLKQIVLPLLHGSIFYVLFCLIQVLWAEYYHGDNNYYVNTPTSLTYLVYSLVWVIGIWFCGGYLESTRKYVYRLRGLLFGLIITLLIYGLLPESMRFSRAILGICGVIGVFVFWMSTTFLNSRSRKMVVHVISDKGDSFKRGFIDLFPLFDVQIWGSDVSKVNTEALVIFDSAINQRSQSLPGLLTQLKSNQTGFYDAKRKTIILAGKPGLQSIKKDSCSHHNLASDLHMFQKGLIDKALAIILLPFGLILKIGNYRKVLSNIKRLLNGQMTFIGLPKRGDLVKTVASIVTLDKIVECDTVDDPLLSYSVHYSIFMDVGYVIKNLFAIFNGLAVEHDK